MRHAGALAACAIGCALVAGCGGAPARAPEAPRAPLHVRPAAGLVPAAGLTWLVDARPRALWSAATQGMDVALPAATLAALEATYGADLRRMDELVVAGFEGARVVVAAGPIDPGAVERAFAARVAVEGRGVDRAPAEGAALERVPITRVWGARGGAREQIAILGSDGAALEAGRFGVLRAVEAFAQERLHRASPALAAAPLARVASALGDAPVRLFVPGPFTGEAATSLGGLAGAASAVGVSLRAIDPARVRMRLVLLDVAERGRLEEARSRLEAAVGVLGQAPFGKLAGLDRPIAGPRATVEPDGVLAVELDLDALALARGFRAAAGASVREVMAY